MRLPAQLLRRRKDSHKGDFGHILILAGSVNFSGAAVLCAEAAIRSGAGLVTLGIGRSLVNAIIKIKPKEVMLLPLPETKPGNLAMAALKKIREFLGKIDVLVIGPGLGGHKQTQGLVRKVIATADKSLVIDADGLNSLAGNLGLLHKAGSLKRTAILTPHPGEMARLLGTTIARVQATRRKIARKFALDYKITLVLKGHHTIVADPEGNIYINKTGNPGMATAGTGDVLTGMIGAFLGQGLAAFEAAKYAVYLHGLAGDLAAEENTEIGMIASDIIAKIPAAIKKSS